MARRGSSARAGGRAYRPAPFLSEDDELLMVELADALAFTLEWLEWAASASRGASWRGR
ncbi:hypothetical protein [Paragemmobacter aquarius]|uniref:hypothetical protein n=1 Tax=Paragemmobacter aquarius TaxID=2169400 RepID=UPI001573F281|nr:hypothetical protein [Gemmobacter aquarius]